MLDEVGPHKGVDVDAVGMLGRQDHGGDELRFAVGVLDRHLALAVGPQVVEHAALAHFGQTVHQLVGKGDGKRHELRAVAAGVAEHHALVAGALAVERVLIGGIHTALEGRVDPLSDVGGLLVQRGDDAARGGVEAVLGPGIADALDGLADQRGHIHVGGGADLARHDYQPRGDQGLAGDVAGRIVSEDRVNHRVRDLVGDLVGMAFAHRLRREQELVITHRS